VTSWGPNPRGRAMGIFLSGGPGSQARSSPGRLPAGGRLFHALRRGHSANSLMSARFDTLFQWLQMPQDAKKIADLAGHRNLLVHEALWNQQQPGTGWLGGPMQADHLSRINDRLLFALAGYRGPYLSTPWWVLGQAPM